MTDEHISFTVANLTGLTSGRIVGYDFARSMTLLGMVIVNYKMVMIDEGPHPEWLLWLLWIVGRIEGKEQPIAKIYNAFGKLQVTMIFTEDGIILGHSDTSVAFPGKPIMSFGIIDV